MRQDLFRGSFRNGTNESATSWTLWPFNQQSTTLKFPISRVYTCEKWGPKSELKGYLNDFTAEASSSFTSNTV